VGSANKYLPEYIFLEMGNIFCNFMNACINALLDRWKSLSETSWLFLFQEIYHQFELHRFVLHHVCYVIKFICTSSLFKENVTLAV